MPGFNGSGTFVRSHDWTTDLSNTVPVTASRMDTEHDGFATGLSTAICKDGQTTTTAVIPFAAGISIVAGGIAFPATQAAVADANTLDDYEEGTFTPALAFGGGTTGLTYASRSGRYTKIGNLVTFWVVVVINDNGSSTGAATVTALPFTAGADCPVWMAVFNGAAIADLAGYNAVVNSAATTISLRYLSEAQEVADLDEGDLTGITTTIHVSGAYVV